MYTCTCIHGIYGIVKTNAYLDLEMTIIIFYRRYATKNVSTNIC